MTVDEDLAAMVADVSLTVPVVYGAVRARGFLDWQDVYVTDSSGGQVVDRRLVLTIAAGAIAAVTDDTDIVVDGVTHRIRTTLHHGDGKVLEVALA